MSQQLALSVGKKKQDGRGFHSQYCPAKKKKTELEIQTKVCHHPVVNSGITLKINGKQNKSYKLYRKKKKWCNSGTMNPQPVMGGKLFYICSLEITLYRCCPSVSSDDG